MSKRWRKERKLLRQQKLLGTRAVFRQMKRTDLSDADFQNKIPELLRELYLQDIGKKEEELTPYQSSVYKALNKRTIPELLRKKMIRLHSKKKKIKIYGSFSSASSKFTEFVDKHVGWEKSEMTFSDVVDAFSRDDRLKKAFETIMLRFEYYLTPNMTDDEKWDVFQRWYNELANDSEKRVIEMVLVDYSEEYGKILPSWMQKLD